VKHIILLTSIFLCGPVFSLDFVCQAKKSSGFYFNKEQGEWLPTIFSTNEQYKIVKLKNTKSCTYDIYIGSQPNQMMRSCCSEDFNSNGIMSCTGFDGDYQFNRNNSRFIRSFKRGYWDVGLNRFGIADTDYNGATPFMEIGTCNYELSR
jgi:hypothetical protein